MYQQICIKKKKKKGGGTKGAKGIKGQKDQKRRANKKPRQGPRNSATQLGYLNIATNNCYLNAHALSNVKVPSGRMTNSSKYNLIT
jgi:hypothetical protein